MCERVCEDDDIAARAMPDLQRPEEVAVDSFGLPGGDGNGSSRSWRNRGLPAHLLAHLTICTIVADCIIHTRLIILISQTFHCLCLSTVSADEGVMRGPEELETE